ncbi:rhamnan synthesis F family protein [Actinomyces oricola]|uniref:rhamnan synthesis F family protein n=1 Tax=Actinomyces oricola TaxID=206043 RepID=UPI000FFF3C24|nr:rhamnan synthesis F family protein [Actinomyces oricola]
MRRGRALGPYVWQVTRGQVTCERGSAAQLRNRERIAVVAQYSADPLQSRSLSEYLTALDSNGYATVLVSTCESPGPLQFPHGLPETTVIMRRPNRGYDFGSWATALGVIPAIRRAPVVLLTNDSLVGPLAPIDHLLDWAAQDGPDIRALTSSLQFIYHLQSYFLAFRGGILQDRTWMDFFNGVRVEANKDAVVLRYELGLSRMCFSEAYSSQEWVTGADIGLPFENPTIGGWKGLLDSGVPFLKRTIVTHPSTVDLAAEAVPYIQHRYGVDVTSW